MSTVKGTCPSELLYTIPSTNNEPDEHRNPSSACEPRYSISQSKILGKHCPRIGWLVILRTWRVSSGSTGEARQCPDKFETSNSDHLLSTVGYIPFLARMGPTLLLQATTTVKRTIIRKTDRVPRYPATIASRSSKTRRRFPKAKVYNNCAGRIVPVVLCTIN